MYLEKYQNEIDDLNKYPKGSESKIVSQKYVTY